MKNLLDCKSRGHILLGSPVCVVFAFRSRPFLSGGASCKPASKYSHTLYLISVKQAMVVLIKEDTNADNSRSLRRAHFMSHSLSTDPLLTLPPDGIYDLPRKSQYTYIRWWPLSTRLKNRDSLPTTTMAST